MNYIKEKANKLGVPVINPIPNNQPENNPVVAVCGQCGLEIRQTMGFVCPQQNCPVQVKVTL